METINRGLRQDTFKEIVIDFNNAPFAQLAGFKLTEVGNGTATIELQAERKLLNSANILHGGVSAALCDTAMGFAVKSLGTISIVTAEMKINYLVPIKFGEKVKAIGRVVKAGQNLCVAEGEIINEENQVAAKSLGTYFVLKNS